MSATRRGALAGLAAGVGAGLAGTLPAPALARRRHDAQVIVIGAGLAGLETALRLEALGLDVLVLEASDRIGGRLHTWTDLPGRPNAGGVQIGASYARLRARAQALGVPLDPEPAAPRGNRIAVGDTLIDPREWAISPLNPFPDAHKSVTPGPALFLVGGPANPLSDFDDWRGLKGVAADQSADAFLAARGFSPAARALIDVGLNANRIDTYSMVNVWRSMTLFSADRAMGGGSSVVRGGSQALPEAMARALKRPVTMGSPVRGIAVDARGATVRLARRTLRAQAVVAATPFPVLAGMAIDAPLSSETRAAIAGLPYTQILQVLMAPETRFWERDGLPIDMWTDGPLERLFSVRDADGADTGQIMVWLNGTGAERARRADLASLIAARLSALRPASEGKARIVRTQDWTTGNRLAGGAYMHWAPGQIARWAGKMGAPAGRLVFAGEHLGLVHTGMESAMESAEAAAGAVRALLAV